MWLTLIPARSPGAEAGCIYTFNIISAGPAHRGRADESFLFRPVINGCCYEKEDLSKMEDVMHERSGCDFRS